jgi:16S rRNA (adenine1518-N6/adenine1519-N6)-dimethyltransferase
LSALQTNSRLIIKNTDVLRVSNQEITESLGQSYKVVANLPYHITSKVIEKFLANEPRPSLLVLLVQKEVAERLCAVPGGRGEGMSVLSVATQFYATPEYVATVPASCFWPTPKVDSAIVKLKVKEDLPPVLEKDFFRLVKIGFSARRKQLHNNLSAGLHLDSAVIKTVLKELNLAENVRPQDLTLDNWLALFTKLAKPL